MKLKQLLTKTLLVAAGLGVGANAWADATEVYERGYTTVWSDADLSDWTVDSDHGTAELAAGGTVQKVTLSIDGGLKPNSIGGKSSSGVYTSDINASYYSYTTSLTITEDVLKFTALWNTGNNTAGKSYNYIQFGDFKFCASGYAKSSTKGNAAGWVSITGLDDISLFSDNNAKGRNADWTISLTINKRTGEYSYSVTVPTDDEYTGSGTLASVGTNYDKIVIGLSGSGSQWDSNQTLKKVKVTEEAASIATYTVKYVDGEGNDVKTADTSREGTIGAAIALTSEDTQDFWTGDDPDVKYIYVSDDSDGKTVASDGSTVVTVTFRTAETWSYTINCIDESSNVIAASIASGTVTEKENTPKVYYSNYLLSNGRLLVADRQSSNPHWGKTFYVNTDNYVGTITYKAASAIPNVVYYSEAEDITGMTSTSSSNIDIRSSHGLGGYNATEANISLVTLPAGQYKLFVRTSGATRTTVLTMYAGETNIMDVTTTSANGSDNSVNFDLNTTTTIYLGKGGDSSHAIDYIYIQKTSETVNFTLGADAGDSYKSYVTTAATDFAATGVTAYIATAANTTAGTVTLTTIDQAPANTPVLLKGTKGGTAEISTTTDEVAAISTNYLVAADGSTAIGASDAKYVLAYNSGWEFRHYNGTLSAGKVYLDLSTVGARAASFSFVFEDEATGISQIENGKLNIENSIFNLNGQRISQPTKGLYIMNGRKVMIK